MWFRRKSKRPDRPLIFVCSPYRGDMETNTQNARQYCRLVMEQGGIPFAPHLLFTQFLDDAIPKERERGLRMERRCWGCVTSCGCSASRPRGCAWRSNRPGGWESLCAVCT